MKIELNSDFFKKAEKIELSPIFQKLMRLLIFTQKVDKNDSNLGFFHDWLEQFSQKLDKVWVVCLVEGRHILPQNVEVFSLGKNLGFSKLRQFSRLQKFLWRNLRQVNGVFYHMCPIFVLASFPFPQLFHKKQVLWFTHKSVNFKLWLASKLVNKIITASEKSCRLKKRKKVQVVGHGIGLNKFKIKNEKLRIEIKNSKFKILTAGRISPSKDLKTLIEAISLIDSRFKMQDLRLSIVGTAVDQLGQEYFEQVKQLVREKNLEQIVHFKGPVPYSQMPEEYQEADLFINLSKTGSIDKAVLEAMAAGVLVLTSNEAFQAILPKEYLFEQGNPRQLAEKIIFFKNNQSSIHTFTLRQLVQNNHNLTTLIDKIISQF